VACSFGQTSKESIRLEGKQDLQTKVTIAWFDLFAEIERDLICERAKEGLAAARARGRLLGRPKGSVGPSKLDGVCIHGPKVTVVQKRIRCGGMDADQAAREPEVTRRLRRCRRTDARNTTV
jgi:Resolvase, N terminal domain